MVEAELKQLVEKALAIDSQIHKHLALAWTRPSMPFMERSGPIQLQKQTSSPAKQQIQAEVDLQCSQAMMDGSEADDETLKKSMELLCDEMVRTCSHFLLQCLTSPWPCNGDRETCWALSVFYGCLFWPYTCALTHFLQFSFFLHIHPCSLEIVKAVHRIYVWEKVLQQQYFFIPHLRASWWRLNRSSWFPRRRRSRSEWSCVISFVCVHIGLFFSHSIPSCLICAASVSVCGIVNLCVVGLSLSSRLWALKKKMCPNCMIFYISTNSSRVSRLRWSTVTIISIAMVICFYIFHQCSFSCRMSVLSSMTWQRPPNSSTLTMSCLLSKVSFINTGGPSEITR